MKRADRPQKKFLHLGGNTAVLSSNVIAILRASTLREGFSLEQPQARVAVSGGQAESYVVCDEAVYVSPIASVTLKKRLESQSFSDL